MKKRNFIFLLFLIINLIGCNSIDKVSNIETDKDSIKVLEENEVENINTKYAVEDQTDYLETIVVDESYDEENIILPKTQSKVGYVNNILDIALDWDYIPSSLASKQVFNEFIESQTNFEFINKVQNDSIRENYLWRIELLNATKEEVDDLIIKLETLPEIWFIQRAQVLLPEFNTPENKERLINSLFQ